METDGRILIVRDCRFCGHSSTHHFGSASRFELFLNKIPIVRDIFTPLEGCSCGVQLWDDPEVYCPCTGFV